MKRTNTCGDLTLKDVNKEVLLQGWVKKIRKLGGLTFIDLRDRYGITQLIASDDQKDLIKDLRPEFVLEVKGTVAPRKTPNLAIPTGEIEVNLSDVKIINKSEVPPFQIEDNIDVLWDTRLKYRYLDLRRPKNQANFLLRSQVNQIIRNYFSEQDFIEVETPFFAKSTPEGARDFLVPSRLNEDKFYALPQSPQLFKQLLMVAGFDRYFQIVRCFRDEDLRLDRELEFTQLDMEMSFATPEDVMEMTETLLKKILKETKQLDLTEPFQRITYREAVDHYGSDKPDLRFDHPIVTVTEAFKNSQNGLFQKIVQDEGDIRAISVPYLLSKAQLKELDEVAHQFNFSSLAFAKFDHGTWSGPIASSLNDDQKAFLIKTFNLTEVGTVLFQGGKDDKVSFMLGAVRNALGAMFQLYQTPYKLLWVIDFPLFEWSEEEQRYMAAHHPFTMPSPKSLADFDTNKKDALANAYDIVMNGFEIGGGSQRITDPELQERMFRAIELSQEKIDRDFGWFINAYNYGAPYHSGLALGLDRILMLLTDSENIRDVIAFPKNLHGVDPMSNAPDYVSEKQLDDLHLALKKETK